MRMSCAKADLDQQRSPTAELHFDKCMDYISVCHAILSPLGEHICNCLGVLTG